MAVSMSKAVVGAVVAIIVYIISFAPFMAIFTLVPELPLWPKLITVIIALFSNKTNF